MILVKSLLAANFLGLFLLVQFGCSSKEKCTLGIEQAPQLRGFRLGMTTDEITQRLGMKIAPANEFGLATVIIDTAYSQDETKPDAGYTLLNAHHFSDYSEFERIQLEIVDARLARIEVAYPNNVQWKSTDEFVDRISKDLNLHGTWEQVGKDTTYSDYKSLFCSGADPGSSFGALVGFKPQTNHDKQDRLPFVEIHDVMKSIQPDLRRSRKAESDAERQRGEFKP